MLKIILCGINGKIGSLIYQLATENSHQIVCGIDKKIVGAFDCPVYNSFCEIKEHADVIVDFSSPTSFDDLLDFALTNQTPIVIGTTGYSLAQEEQIVNASKHISVFKSANMSLGMNLLIKLCKTATSVLQGFDVEIIDTHHKHKKDAPSGTTKMIFDAINESKYKALSPIYGRRGKDKENKMKLEFTHCEVAQLLANIRFFILEKMKQLHCRTRQTQKNCLRTEQLKQVNF